MEPIERHSEKELSLKELQTLLDESFSLGQKMLKQFSNKANPFHASVPATTHEAMDRNKYGTLIIDEPDSTVLYVDLLEKEKNAWAVPTEPKKVEHYILNFDEEEAKYTLATTGPQIDLTGAALLNEEDEFGIPVHHTQGYSDNRYHEASPAEIQRFADIMLLGGGGFGEMFDGDEFEKEFQQYLEEQDKNNPE
jgi:hypothetical protein